MLEYSNMMQMNPLPPDPSSLQSQKALETIGNTLQAQYERWQPRVSSILVGEVGCGEGVNLVLPILHFRHVTNKLWTLPWKR